MAGHGKLVVVDVPDNPLGVYNVGEPGGTQPVPPPDVVEAPHLAGRIAAQGEGKVVDVGKPLQPYYVIRADAYDQGISLVKVRLGVSKLPGLDGSTVGEGPEEEIDYNVPAPVLREVKLPSRNQGHGEGWRNGTDSQHYGHNLRAGKTAVNGWRARAGVVARSKPVAVFRSR